MIQFENVTIERGGKTLIQGVNAHVREGEKVGVRGPSGSGKSSILMAVLGAFPLKEGRILVNGQPVAPDTVRNVRRQIAYIGQEPVLGAEQVHEALTLPFTFKANRGREPSQKQIEAVLERVHLTPAILEKRSNVVSGGEKQRLAVARALLLGKVVFLADEVTSALDDASRDAVIDLLADPDFTVLSVSHDTAWLQRCARVFQVQDGDVVEVQKHEEAG